MIHYGLFHMKDASINNKTRGERTEQTIKLHTRPDTRPIPNNLRNSLCIMCLSYLIFVDGTDRNSTTHLVFLQKNWENVT